MPLELGRAPIKPKSKGLEIHPAPVGPRIVTKTN